MRRYGVPLLIIVLTSLLLIFLDMFLSTLNYYTMIKTIIIMLMMFGLGISFNLRKRKRQENIFRLISILILFIFIIFMALSVIKVPYLTNAFNFLGFSTFIYYLLSIYLGTIFNE